MGVKYECQTYSVRNETNSGLGRFVHMHEEIELVYVKRGAARAYADRQTHLLQAGDLFFSFPNQIHYYEMPERGEVLLLICSPKLLHGLGELLCTTRPATNVVHLEESDPLYRLICDLERARGNRASTKTVGYLHLLLCDLLDRVELTRIDVKKSALATIISYCVLHYQEDINLDRVAQELHLSKYYISHLINRELKRTFNDYINDLRVTQACKLLKETNRRVADISEEVGFGTIRSFNRAFQTVMKRSPLAYRSECRNK